MKTFNIPGKVAAFHTYQAALTSQCAAHAGDWHLPDEAVAALTTLHDQWEPAYAVAADRNTCTPPATAARNAVFTQYREAIYRFINKYLLDNAAVGADSLAVFNIKDRGGTHRPLAAPDSFPVLQIDYRELGAHHLVFNDSAALGSHRKPEGVGFCEIWYQVGGEVPAAPAPGMEGARMTRSGNAVYFEVADKGKPVYYFARWVSRKGEEGPWAPLVSGVVHY